MVFEQIDKLKRDYTDQYVEVDASRPELARFRGVTGQVRTVNMNGRALVEFLDYHANIGWYDIALDYLRVVPKPEAKTEVRHDRKAATKPAPEKAPAAKAPPAVSGGKKSTAEILAAARVKKAAPDKDASAAQGSQPATAPAQRGAAGRKLSTAEIIAAARAAKAATTESAKTAPVDEAAAPAVESPAVAAESAHGAEASTPPAAAQPATLGPKPTTTAEKIAYCRRVDARS